MLKPAISLIQLIAFLILSLTGAAVLSADESRYGPVSNNENLWDIANQFTADGDLKTSQVAVSIFRRNPQAFRENNINGLMQGLILIIPSVTEMQSIPKQSAKKIFMQHWENWKNGITQVEQLENIQLSPSIESSPVSDLHNETPIISSPGNHPFVELSAATADSSSQAETVLPEAETVVAVAEKNSIPEQIPPAPASFPPGNITAVEPAAKASVSLSNDPGFRPQNELPAEQKEKSGPALQETSAFRAEITEPLLTETQDLQVNENASVLKDTTALQTKKNEPVLITQTPLLEMDKNNPRLSKTSALQTAIKNPVLEPDAMTANPPIATTVTLSPEISNHEEIVKPPLTINKPAQSEIEDVAQGGIMSQLQVQIKNNLPYIAGVAGLGLLLLLFLSKEQTYPMVKLTNEAELPDSRMVNDADENTATKIVVEIDENTQEINFAASAKVTETAHQHQNDIPEKNSFNILSEHEIKSSVAENSASCAESDELLNQTHIHSDSDELSAVNVKFKQDYPQLEVIDEEEIFAVLEHKSKAVIAENVNSATEYAELDVINEEELLALLNDESEAAVLDQKQNN